MSQPQMRRAIESGVPDNKQYLHPLLANCLRLTVGAPEENTLMIDALKESL